MYVIDTARSAKNISRGTTEVSMGEGVVFGKSSQKFRKNFGRDIFGELLKKSDFFSEISYIKKCIFKILKMCFFGNFQNKKISIFWNIRAIKVKKAPLYKKAPPY